MKIDDLIYTGKEEIKILSKGRILNYQYIIATDGKAPVCFVGKKDWFCMAVINGDFFSMESFYNKILVHGGMKYSSSIYRFKFMDKDVDYLGWNYRERDDYFIRTVGKIEGETAFEINEGKKWTFNELYEEVVNAIEQLMEYEEEFKETPRI